MSRLLIIIVFLFFWVGCNPSINSLIKSWEGKNNKISIKKISKTYPVKPYLASDSLIILKELYHTETISIEENLVRQVDTLTWQIKKAEADILATNNPLMKKALKNGLESLKYNHRRIQQIKTIYLEHPELTRLQSYLCKITEYSRFPDSILGYSVEVEFLGRQGLLPKQIFTKTYLLNTNQNNILGEIK